MLPIFSIQDLSIVLLVRNQNPALLNLDFLRCSGIVPQDWELASTPILTPQASQIVFQNGLGLIADTNRTIFTEKIAGKSLSNIAVAQVAKLYAQLLPHAEYQALGINPEGFASFIAHPELGEDYLSKTLLSPGTWLDFGDAPARVQLNIAYSLEEGALNLSVSQRLLKENPEFTTSLVLYSGNFEYSFQQVSPTDRLNTLTRHLDQWQLNIEMFTTLINERFLNGYIHNLIRISNSFPEMPNELNTDPLTGETIEFAHY